MRIELKKFGTTLISRPSGKEAFLAFQQTLADLQPEDALEIDFNGVTTFSPSWGDEFLTPLLKQLGDKLILLPSENPSIKITIDLLEKTQGKKFKRMVQL